MWSSPLLIFKSIRGTSERVWKKVSSLKDLVKRIKIETDKGEEEIMRSKILPFLKDLVHN
jgi:hypothetical protein